jgi:hypothetical protein
MEVCYWALLFMPLVILHHLLNVFVQLANKKGFKQKKKTLISADTEIVGKEAHNWDGFNWHDVTSFIRLV